MYLALTPEPAGTPAITSRQGTRWGATIPERRASMSKDECNQEDNTLFSLLDQIAANAAKQHEEEDDGLSPAERFEEYHRSNPGVYAVMVAFAREWKDRTGRPKLGINSLIERVRWEVAIRTSDPEFKINNNFGPWYSRLIMKQEPDLSDLFETRKSIADEWGTAA